LPPFRILIEKNIAEAKKINYLALGKDAVFYSTCKKWFQRFRFQRVEIWISRMKNARNNKKNLKMKHFKRKTLVMQSELADAFGITQQTISKRFLNK